MKFKSNLEVQFHTEYPDLAYESDRLKYTKEHSYTPDWKVADNCYIETKGWFLPSDRSKLKLVRDHYPNVKILVVFNNKQRKLSKTSKTTYEAWCIKQKFDCCNFTEKQVIQDWIVNHTKGESNE